MKSLNNEQLKSLFSDFICLDDHVNNHEDNHEDNSFNRVRFITRHIKLNTIKRVIFNNPATIILWENGKKTVVKVQEGDKYDKRVGFLMCYLKGIVGNKTLLKEVEKWLSEKE